MTQFLVTLQWSEDSENADDYIVDATEREIDNLEDDLDHEMSEGQLYSYSVVDLSKAKKIHVDKLMSEVLKIDAKDVDDSSEEEEGEEEEE